MGGTEMARAFAARVAVGTAAIPDEWLAENGYGEWAVTAAARPIYDATGTTRIGHEDSEPWLRLRPGINHEHALYHYMTGKRVNNRYTTGVAAAQWAYKGTGKVADRMAQAAALTTGNTLEVAA